MPRPSFRSPKTPREQLAYRRAMDVHTYLRQSERRPLEYPPLSRAELAQHFQTTSESVERYLGSAVRREGRGWVTVESGAEGLGKAMNLVTEDGIKYAVPITNAGDRSLVGRHHAAIGSLEQWGNSRPLYRLRRVRITDAYGARHRLLTDEREVRGMIRRGELRGLEPY